MSFDLILLTCGGSLAMVAFVLAFAMVLRRPTYADRRNRAASEARRRGPRG